MVEWGIGIDRREFRSKATEREHVIHTSAYPNESVHILTLSIMFILKLLTENQQKAERGGGGWGSEKITVVLQITNCMKLKIEINGLCL